MMIETIDYDGKAFQPAVSEGTTSVKAAYHQHGALVWGEFGGGNVQYGTLAGLCQPDGVLELAYCMIENNVVVAGHCTSTPERLPDGRIRLREQWRRFTPSALAGVSYLEEVPR
jgi:hypothetical protein